MTQVISCNVAIASSIKRRIDSSSAEALKLEKSAMEGRWFRMVSIFLVSWGALSMPMPGTVDTSTLLVSLSDRLREFCAKNGIDCSYGAEQTGGESYANESNEAVTKLAALAKLAAEKLSSVSRGENASATNSSVLAATNTSAIGTDGAMDSRSTKWSPLLTVVSKWMNDNTFWLIVLQLLAILGLFVRRWLVSCRRGLERKGYTEADTEDRELEEVPHRDTKGRTSFSDDVEDLETETRLSNDAVRRGKRRRTMSVDRSSFSRWKDDDEYDVEDAPTVGVANSMSRSSRERLRDELKREMEKSNDKSVHFEEPEVGLGDNVRETRSVADDAEGSEKSEAAAAAVTGGYLKHDGSYVSFDSKEQVPAAEKRNRWPYNYLRSRTTETQDEGKTDTSGIRNGIASPPVSVLSRGKTRLKR